MSRASARWSRIAAVLLVLALLLVAQRLGVFHQFANPGSAAQTLVRLGPWGYLAFVVAYAVFQPFGVPGTAFVVAAPLIWPWPIAYALSMTGSMAASSIGFSFARFVGRDWLATKIPARFRKYDDALANRAFSTVFFLRLIFWMPPLLHAFFGVSKVRFWTHFSASFLGYLLPLFLISFFGQRLFDALRAAPPTVWIGLAAAVALFVSFAWTRRRRLARASLSVPTR
jgi:uncharacterized membrane protein YdjX (TVP38/TMEM64 family)